MVAVKTLLFFCAIGAQAWAAGLGATGVVCSTKLDTVSIAPNQIPTSTATVVNKITVIKKVVRKVNVVVVPKAKTTTIRTTSVITTTATADPRVETATSIITSEITVYSTQTSTSVTTSDSTTVTTKYVTETVPTVPGWIAIKSESRYVPRHKVRAEVDDGEIQDSVEPTPVLYAQRVDCVKKKPTTSIKTVTTKVQGKRVTLKAATKSVMSTIVKVSTVTEYPPDLSTTVTLTVYPTTTSWTETTSVSTVVQTVVVESQVPIATEYAACYDSNILMTANGGKVITATSPADIDSLFTYNIGAGYTATSCCEACHKNPSCRYSRFIEAESKCIIQIYPVRNCPTGELYKQQAIGRYFTSVNTLIKSKGFYSNGPCGYFYDGGTDILESLLKYLHQTQFNLAYQPSYNHSKTQTNNIFTMTTNSFGSALPRFDFHQPPAPRFTARLARSLPTAALVTTAAATYCLTYYVLRQQYTMAKAQHNRAVETLNEMKERGDKTDEWVKNDALWWTAF
ncbi:unnamed protein product [Fusarium graminearum]|uniref:Apple domain-containing protein n=1 Tax=Gibberella zeae TaxID=5518 RepID=A0A9N8R6Z1_GIBZA|nr:unnamed protein product [Fusarium graminearum]